MLWASTTPTQPAEARAQTAGRHCPTYPSVCTARISCSTNYGRRQLQHNPLKPEPRLPSTLPNLLPQCALPGSPAAQSYGRRQLQHNPLKPEAQTAGRHSQLLPQCALPGSPAAQSYGRRQLQHNPLKPEAQTAGRHCPTYPLSVHCQDLLQHKIMGCALPGSPAAQSYGRRQLQHNPLKPEAQTAGRHCPTTPLSVHCQDLLQHKLWASTTPTQPAEARGPDCRSTLPNLPLSVHCQDLLQHKLWASTTPTQPAEARGPGLPVDIAQPTPSVCTARISCSTKLWASTAPTQPAEAKGPDCRSTLPNLLPQCALPRSPAAQSYGRRQLQHNPLKPEAQTAGRPCPIYPFSLHCQDLLQYKVMGVDNSNTTR
ncbi:hypothetical protein JTE90_013823 [Oedothorax gibbosus]|uniref:Uncharacterized protein n=1 Tax=Oedothorax gibbosus TaxID=931172 RepID=A0AAV6VKW8_9ARAC|nr:hypothetical protein JTE90_013823 [Oedothorax gibbosus]